ncbi:MAG: pyridoxamine 5'-phosphate oxidase family protein [Alphaproteobacteria bacterium]|nr:pyridoxamine 5'-phosphate oxidase family protein [Alphaproteobacteria bacterium]
MDFEPLWQDIEAIGIGMVTTWNAGNLQSRPMLASVDREDDALYFFTRAGDHKVEEVRRRHEVGVSFVDSAKEIYIAVAGQASIVNDREKAREHRSLAALAWFDDGVEDDGLRLLKVDVHRAERWDVTANPLKKAWEIIRSQKTPRTPDVTENTTFQRQPEES